MNVEVMLYVYGFVCASMIVFNVVYNLLLKRSEPRLERRCRRLREKIEPQLARLRDGGAVEPGHLALLQRKLSHVKNLIAFDRILGARNGEIREPWEAEYVRCFQPVLLSLAMAYEKQNAVNAAYFSYFLSRYMEEKHMPIHSLQDILLEYVRRDNLYCQVNALQALYRFGSAEHILRALLIQDAGSVFLHEKILTEGLLTFTGDHSELVRLLWDNLDRFSEHTQLAVSNYIRFQTGELCGEMLGVLQDGKRGKELRLSAIRYFGRYFYEPAREPLLALASLRDPEQWEYVTVSVSALSRYPGERTVAVLKQALHSANWYVRFDAAASLEALRVDIAELTDILAGNDRYAREMLQYRMESGRMRKAGG